MQTSDSTRICAGGIMIIEQSTVINGLMHAAFGDRECRMVTCSSVDDMLVSDFDPDEYSLIILDLDIAADSGEAASMIQGLKEDDYTCDIPLIAVGTTRTPSYVIAALEAGADDYIAKPVAPRELIARLRTILRRRI